MSTEYDHLLKVLLIGDSGVGKSSFLLKFANNEFTEQYISTIGVDFKIKEINYANKKIKLQIWDTAGQERFRTITSSYYCGAHCILIMFDLTDIETFNNVKIWLDEINKHATIGVIKLLIGTKNDLISKRNIDDRFIKDLVSKHDMLYIETSAKNGDGVQSAFEMVCEIYINKLLSNPNHNKKPPVLLRTLEQRKNNTCC